MGSLPTVVREPRRVLLTSSDIYKSNKGWERERSSITAVE